MLPSEPAPSSIADTTFTTPSRKGSQRSARHPMRPAPARGECSPPPKRFRATSRARAGEKTGERRRRRLRQIHRYLAQAALHEPLLARRQLAPTAPPERAQLMRLSRPPPAMSRPRSWCILLPPRRERAGVRQRILCALSPGHCKSVSKTPLALFFLPSQPSSFPGEAMKKSGHAWRGRSWTSWPQAQPSAS